MFKIALKYGILIVVFIFLWGVLEYLAGLRADAFAFHPVATLFSLVIPLIFLYMGMREAQKKYTGAFTYGQAFKTGLFISLLVAILYPLGQWLYQALFAPEFFESMQAFTEAKQLAEGVDPVVARRLGPDDGGFSLSSYLLRSFLGALVAGLIMSAMLALFVRDKTLPKGG